MLSPAARGRFCFAICRNGSAQVEACPYGHLKFLTFYQFLSWMALPPCGCLLCFTFTIEIKDDVRGLSSGWPSRVVIKSITFKTASHLLPQVYFPPYFSLVNTATVTALVLAQNLPKAVYPCSLICPIWFVVLTRPESFAPNISWQTSSVKGQRINILGFASHI